MAEKYYWLKLKKDFFKRHDITIIETMPNGKDYILFYLKLLCESIDHEGHLRFSETIPYSEEMLATITRTNVDIVRSAMKVFTSLNMIEILDDKTIFMTEVQKMLGSETYWAQRKRIQRAKQQCPTDVQLLSKKCPTDIDIEKDIDKDIDIDKDKEKDIESIETKSSDKPRSNKFIKPTVEEIAEYCRERDNGIDAQQFYDFYESKGWLIGKNKMKDWKAAVRTWESRNQKNKPKVAGPRMMTGDE